MELSTELKKQVHDNIKAFADRQEEIILKVYEMTYKDIPEDLSAEQRNSIVDHVFKSIFDSFNNAVEQQKKASDAFFGDKSNLDNIINIVKQEKSKNE